MKKLKPAWKPICRQSCRQKIIAKGRPFKFNLKNHLLKYGKPSSTVDIWTSKQRLGYMAVTMHLQNKHQAVSKVMDVAYIPSPHTAANIAKCYNTIVGQFGLNPEDFFKTVCDNASNMKKAFRVSLWDNEDIEQPEQGQACGNELDLVVDPEEEFQDIAIDFKEVFREQYRVPCTIHTLQLFVKDVLAELPQRFQTILQRAKLVCRKQHQSVKLTECTDFVLPAHSETRWNGQFKLLKTVEKNFEEVVEKLGGFLMADKCYTSSLCWLLEPMQKMTTRLESEKITTIHHVIPSLVGLEHHLLSAPKHPNQPFPQQFRDKTMQLLKNRFGFVVEDCHLLAAAALSLHALKWLPGARREALNFGSKEEIIDLIKPYIANLIQEINASGNLEGTACNFGQHPLPPSLNDFGYVDHGFVAACMNTAWESDLSNHFLRAESMSGEMDAVAYWKSQPDSALKIVAIQILNVPAASAPVERVFSLCGNICTATRTSMGPDLLAAIVRAKFNARDEMDSDCDM
jgi:hypothetical protein